MYARGMILDMQRISESGRSMHQIPRYETDEKTTAKHRLWIITSTQTTVCGSRCSASSSWLCPFWSAWPSSQRFLCPFLCCSKTDGTALWLTSQQTSHTQRVPSLSAPASSTPAALKSSTTRSESPACLLLATKAVSSKIAAILVAATCLL